MTPIRACTTSAAGPSSSQFPSSPGEVGLGDGLGVEGVDIALTQLRSHHSSNA